MIPLATTTISILRGADDYAEPYSGGDSNTVVAAGVRAVIGRPAGREQIGGGEQSVLDTQLACDPADLRYTDIVRDDTDGIEYRVVWTHTYPGEVTEALLRNVNGDL